MSRMQRILLCSAESEFSQVQGIEKAVEVALVGIMTVVIEQLNEV